MPVFGTTAALTVAGRGMTAYIMLNNKHTQIKASWLKLAFSA